MASPFERARARWPGLSLDAATFERHASAVAEGGRGGPAESHVEDLFLACACAYAVPGAVEALERTYGACFTRAAAKIDADPDFVADVAQAAREHLFVAAGGGIPRIAEYAGRAPLASWLHVATTRLAISLRRRKSERPHTPFTSSLDAMSDGATPELTAMRAQYGEELRASIRAALGQLATRERTLLRLHLADRMSIDGVAAVYSVGRSTAARWLAAARESLGDAARRDFCARIGVTPSEFDSIAAALKSDLDVSLIAHLDEGAHE